MQEKRIQYLDSMGGSHEGYLQSIFQYLQDEHQDKKKGSLPNAEQWTLEPCNAAIPRQRNGFDCGAFVCRYVDRMARNLPLDFDQQGMNDFRRQIALSILDNEVWE